MTVPQASRLALYEKMKTQIGAEDAATLMELLPTVDFTQFATKDDIAGLRTEMLGQMNLGFGQIERRFGEIEGRFGEIEGRFGVIEGQFGRLERRVAALVVGFALSVWMGFAALVVTMVITA